MREVISDAEVPSRQDEARLRAAVAEAGIREFPFPFRSAIAVASDIDRSTRTNYQRYVGQLVREHGLDFGDSAYVHWWPGRGAGLGFISPASTTDPPAGDRHHLDLYEMLDEHHRGNVDHFHSLLLDAQCRDLPRLRRRRRGLHLRRRRIWH